MIEVKTKKKKKILLEKKLYASFYESLLNFCTTLLQTTRNRLFYWMYITVLLLYASDWLELISLKGVNVTRFLGDEKLPSERSWAHYFFMDPVVNLVG